MRKTTTNPEPGETPALPRKPGRPRKVDPVQSFLRDVQDAAEFSDQLRQQLEYLPGRLDSEFIFRTAQAVFEADVARKGDLKNHIALRRLRQVDRAQDETFVQRERAIEQREKQLLLAREKFEFDAAASVLDHLTEVRAIAADRTLRHRAKIDKVRLRLFGAPPELEPAPMPVTFPLSAPLPDPEETGELLNCRTGAPPAA